MNHRVFRIALWFLCTAPLWGQIFPEQEYLDVITTVDGSVLTGIVADDVNVDRLAVDAARMRQGLEPLRPSRSALPIEIYGGSVFVIAVENIQQITRRRNPDYGRTPPAISLDDMIDQGTAAFVVDPAADNGTVDGAETAEPVATTASGRPILADGWFFGLSGTVGRAEPGGSGWEDVTDTLDAKQYYGSKQGFGVYVERFTAIESERRLQPSWGIRSGVGFYETYAGFESDIDLPDTGTSYELAVEYIYLPVEGLIGIGGGRLFGFVGAGFGLSFHTSAPDEQWKQGDGVYDWPEYDDGLIPSFIASLGGVLRIGARVAVEGRVFYERDLASWYVDFEQYITIAPGVSLGVAYSAD